MIPIFNKQLKLTLQLRHNLMNIARLHNIRIRFASALFVQLYIDTIYNLNSFKI